MVIHAQRNQGQDGSNTAGHERGGMWEVGVPQRRDGGVEGDRGNTWGMARLQRRSVTGTRGEANAWGTTIDVVRDCVPMPSFSRQRAC